MTTELVVWLLQCVVANLAVLAVVITGIGATAPRWPSRWLGRDRGPLRTFGWETPQRYRRLPTGRWGRALPEAGTWFGGVSKSERPAPNTAAIDAYLVEVRRAEWVHWLSFLALLPLLAYNPWYLWLAFALIAAAFNFPFIAILRNNRIRLSAAKGQA